VAEAGDLMDPVDIGVSIAAIALIAWIVWEAMNDEG
jgi:hypothetical protein